MSNNVVDVHLKLHQHIARLQTREVDLLVTVSELRESNQALKTMMEEAIKIFSAYLNVPESRALQERWEKLKDA